MNKKLMVLFLSVVFLTSASAAFAADVYVTKQGKRYHTNTCKLVKSKGATAMDEAKAAEQGYKPCERCFKEKADASPAVKKVSEKTKQ